MPLQKFSFICDVIILRLFSAGRVASHATKDG